MFKPLQKKNEKAADIINMVVIKNLHLAAENKDRQLVWNETVKNWKLFSSW